MRYILAVLGVVAISATTALAQQAQPCGQRAVIVAALAEKYGEAPVLMGLSEERVVTEIFGAVNGGTWTAIMTRPDGLSCIIAAGKTWRSIPFKAPVAGQEM